MNNLPTPSALSYTADEQRLLDRLANDRYDATAPSEGADDRDFRRWFNAGADHVAQIVKEWLDDRVMERAARRLCARHDAVHSALAPGLDELRRIGKHPGELPEVVASFDCDASGAVQEVLR